MSLELKGIYQFNRFRLDANQKVLFEGDKIVPLPPKLFETLLALVEHQGRIIEKDELMSRVWPDSFVEENNLNKNISVLRKLLGEDKEGQVFIETIPKRGYRFVAPVEAGLGNDDELIVATHTSMHVVVEEETTAPEETTDAFNAGGEAALAGNAISATQRPVTSVAMVRRLPRLVMVSALTVIALIVGGYFLWPKPAVTASPINSIAVLPFKPLIAGGQNELIEMGMSETLINRLSGISAISVRPMSAVRKYSALEQDPVAAGQEQKVDAVLEGNIQKTGERVRVTVRLVRVIDGRTLWADKFDERSADIFVLQDSISEKIMSMMAIRLSGEEKQLLTKHHTENPEAYQFYLKGRTYYNQGTEESSRKALESFDQAIALDPNYALAYTGKSNVYSASASQYVAPSEAMPKARAEIQKALDLDGQLAEAHFSMARIKLWADWDWPGAEAEFKTAIALSPSFEEARLSFVAFLILQKRFEECTPEFAYAKRIDPLSINITYNLGVMFYAMRQFDKAVESYREVLALSPNHEPAQRGLGLALREKGMHEEAIAALKRTLELNHRDQFVSELGYTYAVAGRRSDAINTADELEGLAKQRYVSPVRIARIYVGLGEKEKAFGWLNKGFTDRSDHLLSLGIDPSFDSLRTEPRFKELLRRLGLEN